MRDRDIMLLNFKRMLLQKIKCKLEVLKFMLGGKKWGLGHSSHEDLPRLNSVLSRIRRVKSAPQLACRVLSSLKHHVNRHKKRIGIDSD